MTMGSHKLNELMKKCLADKEASADAKARARAVAHYPRLLYEVEQLIVTNPANTSATVTTKEDDKSYVKHLKQLFEADGHHTWLGTTGVLHIGWADEHVTKVPKVL